MRGKQWRGYLGILEELSSCDQRCHVFASGEVVVDTIDLACEQGDVTRAL